MNYLINFKLYENVAQSKAVLKSLDIPQTDGRYVDLREIFKGNEGYLGWATKMVFIEEISLDEINNIKSMIINQRNIIQSLPKELVKYDNWEDLMDDIIKVTNNVNIKRIYNEFPSSQKDAIDLKNEDHRDMLLKLSKMKDKDNFIKKVSRYRSSELINALKLFVDGKRDTKYAEILKSVENSNANIVYKNESNNLIICSVDYDQCRTLGSDTSWCIVGSRSTFMSYANEEYIQYIFFLTDKTDNYSKIGATIGFDLKTAHIKNDARINERDLSSLMIKRGFDLNKLKISIQAIVDNGTINTMSVDKILRLGDKQEMIDLMLNHKKMFKSNELDRFTDEDVKKYNLKEKVEIVKSGFAEFIKKIDDKYNFIIKNKDRINFKFDFEIAISTMLSPNQLNEFVKEELFDKHTIKYIKNIQDHKSNILDQIWRYYSYPVVTISYRSGQEEVKESSDRVNCALYILQLSGVTSYSYDFKDVAPKLKGGSYDLSSLRNYLTSAGFMVEENYDLIFKVITKSFITSSSDSKDGELVRINKHFPEFKDKIRDNVVDQIKKSNYYDSDLDVIKEYYPDLYDDAKLYTDLNDTMEKLKKINYTTTGFNYSRDDLYNPQRVYEELWPNIKKGIEIGLTSLEGWGNPWRLYECTERIVFLIMSLIKSGHMEETKDIFKSLTNEGALGKLIRFCMGYYPQFKLNENLTLTEKECEDFMQFLIQNVHPTPQYRYTDGHTESPELIRHRTFSVIYYKYGWGFSNYMNIVKKITKNYRLDNKWVTLRIAELRNVLSYCAIHKEYDDFKNIVDQVLEWRMPKSEQERMKAYLSTKSRLTNNFNINSYSTKDNHVDEFIQFFKTSYPKFYEEEKTSRNNYW